MKIKGIRWWIIALIFLATVINYIDRSTLGIMWGNPGSEGSIAKSLDLTKENYGLILNIFMVAYALGQLFSGRLFDRVGTRLGARDIHWYLGYFIISSLNCTGDRFIRHIKKYTGSI